MTWVWVFAALSVLTFALSMHATARSLPGERMSWWKQQGPWQARVLQGVALVMGLVGLNFFGDDGDLGSRALVSGLTVAAWAAVQGLIAHRHNHRVSRSVPSVRPE